MAVLQEKTSAHAKISIVIVTYNRPKLASDLANSILKSYPEAEILIVEQGSNYNKDVPKPITYIHLDEINISQARNAGWQKTTNEIVLFLDDDVEITETTIECHLDSYVDPKVIAVTGRVINDGDVLPKDTDVETGRSNLLATKFTQNFWSTKAQSIDFMYGCNMSFRKRVLKKIIGFDPYFNRIFDDLDIGKRVGKFGIIRFVPQALVYHHKAQSGGTRVDGKNKNRLLYLMYGYYIAKHVLLPLCLITLGMRSVTALKNSPYALPDLYKGFFHYYFRPHT